MNGTNAPFSAPTGSENKEHSSICYCHPSQIFPSDLIVGNVLLFITCDNIFVTCIALPFVAKREWLVGRLVNFKFHLFLLLVVLFFFLFGLPGLQARKAAFVRNLLKLSGFTFRPFTTTTTTTITTTT